MKMTAKRHPRGVQGVQNEPRGIQKAPKSVKEASWRRKGRFSRVLQLKMGAQRHPRVVQGVQNEQRGVPETSRRRPRVSKKRPGGAKLGLLVFYNVFKRPRSTGRMRGWALITYRLGRLTEQNITKPIFCTFLHNLPVPQQGLLFTQHALACRRHGADLIAYAHSAGPRF